VDQEKRPKAAMAAVISAWCGIIMVVLVLIGWSNWRDKFMLDLRHQVAEWLAPAPDMLGGEPAVSNPDDLGDFRAVSSVLTSEQCNDLLRWLEQQQREPRNVAVSPSVTNSSGELEEGSTISGGKVNIPNATSGGRVIPSNATSGGRVTPSNAISGGGVNTGGESGGSNMNTDGEVGGAKAGRVVPGNTGGKIIPGNTAERVVPGGGREKMLNRGDVQFEMRCVPVE
jgi:hypothetical protein